MWHFRIWSSRNSGVGQMVGLNELKRSFPTYDSMIPPHPSRRRGRRAAVWSFGAGLGQTTTWSILL